MDESLISRRYAKALLAYARELDEEQALYERMRILSQTCIAMPQLIRTLCSPVIFLPEKEALIGAAAGVGNQKSYDAFVRIVVENRREAFISGIALAYMKLYRENHNISVITLTSTKPLPEGIYGRISKIITSRTHGTAEVETHIDESIGGGFILQVDDMRLDASVKGQLEKIKRQLTNKAGTTINM